MLIVYFNAPGGRPRSLRQWARIARFRPSVTLSHLSRWTIGFLTRCEFADVAVGDEFFTLELNPRGDRLLPAEWYFLHYPNLAWCVVVPHTPHNPHNPLTPDPRRRWIKVTMPLSWITGGRFPSHDCVQKARRILLVGYGIRTPTICSPAELWDWLRSEGYEFIPIRDTGPWPTPKNSATSRSGFWRRWTGRWKRSARSPNPRSRS